MRAAEVDILLDGPPALQLGHLEEMLPRPQLGRVIRWCHGGLLDLVFAADLPMLRVWPHTTPMGGGKAQTPSLGCLVND
jgi:hypothetical protein